MMSILLNNKYQRLLALSLFLLLATGLTALYSIFPILEEKAPIALPAFVPEICNNGIDDDLDGLVDCLDSDCSKITLNNVTVSSVINHPLKDVATVTLNVAWATPPANDSITVTAYGKKRYINTGSAAGNQNLTFNVPADGTTNNPITAAWKKATSLCAKSASYNAPASASSERIKADILYLCGDDKPWDGDAWDHGFISYLDEINGSYFVMPVLTKPDASGYGIYDPMNPNNPLTLNFSDYELIIVSATTESHIASALVSYLKDTPIDLINSNYLIVNELGLSTGAEGYQFQPSAYINNTTSKTIYDYEVISPYFTQVFTKADVSAGGDGYLWANANNQTPNTNSFLFFYDNTDPLSGVAATHGDRVYLGYHMNGIYVGAETGYTLPAPANTYLNPIRHFTLDGKYYFDQALALIGADFYCVEICNNGIDDDGDGLMDCNDNVCKPTLTYAIADCQAANADINLTVAGSTTPYNYRWSDMVAEAIWAGNNSTNDVSGYAHNLGSGSVGTIAYDAADRIEGSHSFSFNGATFLRYGVDGGFLETSYTARTYSMWVKPANLTGIKILFEQGSSTAGMAARLNGNLLSAAIRVGGVQSTTGTLTFPNDGAWHHVAVVYNAGTLTCYLDGVAGSNVSSGSSIAADSNNDGLGGRNGTDAFGSAAANYYSGKLDDIRLYYSALTAQKIADMARNDGDRLNLTAGTYTVTVTSSTGCTATQAVTMTIPCAENCSNLVDDDGDGLVDCADSNCPIPTSSISGNTAICAGGSTTLTASGGSTYTWSTGATAAAITLTPASTSTYTVTATNANGCTATSSLTVTVSPNPTASVSGTNTICSGISTTLTASGGGTYSWSTGAATASITVSPAATTTYTVTVSNAAGCTAVATRTVTVNATPAASISGLSTICNGTSTILTATGGGTYAWSTGATSAAINLTPASTTSYSVTVTNASSCTSIASLTVTVNTCSEICNNSIDDDGDGLIDAADPDCVVCPAPTTAPYIVQEYLLPYPEDQVFNAFKAIFPSNAGCGYPLTVPNVSAPLRCYISVAPYLNSTIVYYDQWEDGYETEITMPTQATTKIWGDGNPANGIPPGFATDVINAGQAIVLQNNINPSNPNLVDYDGRDRIGVSKPVSVTKSHWATGSETLMAGTMLVYPTTDWGTFFKIPLGENVNTSIQSFSYSGFSVMAHQNGTTVNIDANADGAFETNITLNKGQAYQVNGGVLKGARIQSSLPVQVYLTAGDVCDIYENRWFNIPPLDSWGSYFFGPVSGTDKLYAIYNPNATSIIIRGKSSIGDLADQTIAANSVTFTTGIANSGFQFFSKDGSPFLVLAMSDAANTGASFNKTFDWGSTLLPEGELNQQVVVGWAPGHDPNFISSENSAPVWATISSSSSGSLSNTAKVCVDYNGDGIGSLTDSYGRGYDAAFNLAPLVSQKIYDPDGNQTNMLLYVCDGSNALISAVWGEDAATASPASPGLDLGNGIPGIKSFYAYKTGNLFTDVNSNSLFNIGDVVQYKIGIANQGLVQTSGSYNVKDLLPSYVTYVAGSTQLTKPGPVVSAISDAGSTIFPLDEGGTNVTVTLNPGQEAFITFRATVNSKPPAPGYVTNLATVSKSGLVYDLNWSFCVTVSPEICGNSIDDDQDGLVDCNDPDCFVSGAAGGGTVCLGSTISLTASGGTSYNWTGPASFTSTAQNPTRASATALMSGNYNVTITGSGCTTIKTVAVNVSNCSPASAACDAPGCVGPSLISAGTFEGFSTGSPGFTTDFNYINCGSISNGYYSVLQSAANCSSTWAAAPDHTTGNGNGKYMVADFATTSPGQNLNGNSTSGDLFCVATIPVNANTNYCFSGWFLKLCSSCTGEPDIKFMVNGIQVGTVAGTAFSTGAWTKKGFSFLTSDFGNPSTIMVCIAQNAFGSNGYDLALDDIELREILSGTTPTVVSDAVTSCTATPLTINVLANDASYTASTLTIVSQPPASAGTVSKSGTNLLFTPVPGYTGQVSFTYSVCGAVNGCCTQGSVTVTIAPVTASASSDTPVCAGVDLHLSASGGNTYAWTGPNGFTANTAYATINNATVAATGTYTVTVSNSSGCTAQATVVATVNACVTNRKPECNCN
jgi:uncharacterized repeat protein (TIGR01451 family)